MVTTLTYNIYTDGACSGNPGPGGWGVVIINQDEEIIHTASGNQFEATNNQMELDGFISALEWCCANTTLNDAITIYIDSAYIYNCFKDKWHEGWIRRGWKNAAGQLVANRERWERALSLYRQLASSITLSKVTGHSGNEWNEYADELAVRARKSL